MAIEITRCENHAAAGWQLKGGDISLFLTEQGGQHAPVNFFANSDSPVQPYFLNPWQDDRPDLSSIPLLQYLRGDFFCLPFGGNGDKVNGIQFQCHGETSACAWKEGQAYEEDGKAVFEFVYDGQQLPMHVVKHFEMHDKQSALYIRHTVSGLNEKMPYGHHAILRMPAENEKMYFSCGKFDFGMTPTSLFSDPKGWEYQFLASGAEFDRIEAIPTCFKSPDTYDFSTYPTPAGYADLFAMFKKPSKNPAWAVAAYPDNGYLFYTLKNPEELPATTIWVSNSGRYEFPWNGITRCFAIEETCSYFADGWKPSIEENALTRKGWMTCREFKAEQPYSVSMIQGVARIPANFGKVSAVGFTPGQLTFTDENGNLVTSAVDWDFLAR